MKKPFHFLTACAFTAVFIFIHPQSVLAQNTNPLGFQAQIVGNNHDLGDTVELVFKANIPKGWHLYGAKSDCPADDGPIRAEITLDSGTFTRIGEMTEVGSHSIKDTEVWNCTTSEFSDSCEFRIKVRVNGAMNGITAHLYAQKCSETDGMCLMVKEEIHVPLAVSHSRPPKHH